LLEDRRINKMPQIQKATQETVARRPELPIPTSEAVFDEATNELVVTTRFSFDYPDEAVINRLGRLPKDEKGNPTGEPKPVTSRTYGRLLKFFTGAADAENNPLMVDVKLYAPTKEAEEENAASEDAE
jgi:hypothetical protein